ncbi:MAG: hypothetical protein OXG58_10815 [Gemmatimonadetes bacterium]|nr:hypothetical protein [Gemmatimonadota bacterium]MCY3943466.1 hypothetical protein [Gemmatimonadota bacterium]
MTAVGRRPLRGPWTGPRRVPPARLCFVDGVRRTEAIMANLGAMLGAEAGL